MQLSDFNRKHLTVSNGMTYTSYGWRYQIQELTQRGYRVIVPDQAGCGDTAAVNAAAEILKHENVNDQIIVLGHDCLCTPPAPAGQQGQKEPDIDFIISRIPSFGYQKWFQTPEADATIDPHTREFMMMAYWNIWSGAWKPDDGVWSLEGNLQKMLLENIPKLQAATVPSSELQEYVDTFEKGGMQGPLSWYKTRVLNFKDEVEYHLPKTFPPNVPCLMLAATNDGALPLAMSDPSQMAPLFPGKNIERKVIENSDHWLLQDPRIRHEVVKTVGDWVDAQCSHQSKPNHVQDSMSENVNVSLVA
ncbi:epoxide hydrolase [Melampsora americana]|nr:epoxide hydrolase [Melampsora americana]